MSDRYVVRYKRFPNNRVYSKTIHKESCRYAKKPDKKNWNGYFNNLTQALDFCKNTHLEGELIKLCKVCKPEPLEQTPIDSKEKMMNFSERYFFNILDEYFENYRKGVKKYGNIWKVFYFSMVTFSLIFLFVAVYLAIFYLP